MVYYKDVFSNYVLKDIIVPVQLKQCSIKSVASARRRNTVG